MIDEEVLEFLRDKLRVRVRAAQGGWLYARLSVHSPNVTLLDKVVRSVADVRACAQLSVVPRAGTFGVYILAQPTVVGFCDALLPCLDGAEPLYIELTFARAIAAAPWYERYAVVKEYLGEEVNDDGDATD